MVAPSTAINEADLNPNVRNRNKGERQPVIKNEFSKEQIAKLTGSFMDNCFEYQLNWHKAGLAHRIRNILKSRQMGATFYFAREALIDALTTGATRFFYQPARRRPTSSKTTSSTLRDRLTLTSRAIRLCCQTAHA